MLHLVCITLSTHSSLSYPYMFVQHLTLQGPNLVAVAMSYCNVNNDVVIRGTVKGGSA